MELLQRKTYSAAMWHEASTRKPSSSSPTYLTLATSGLTLPTPALFGLALGPVGGHPGLSLRIVNVPWGSGPLRRVAACCVCARARAHLRSLRHRCVCRTTTQGPMTMARCVRVCSSLFCDAGVSAVTWRCTLSLPRHFPSANCMMASKCAWCLHSCGRRTRPSRGDRASCTATARPFPRSALRQLLAS